MSASGMRPSRVRIMFSIDAEVTFDGPYNSEECQSMIAAQHNAIQEALEDEGMEDINITTSIVEGT